MATAATVNPSPKFRPQSPPSLASVSAPTVTTTTTTTTTVTATATSSNNNDNNNKIIPVNNNASTVNITSATGAGVGATASVGAPGGIPPRSAHPANYVLNPRQHHHQQQQETIMSTSASSGYSVAAGAASPITTNITATTPATTASITAGSPATLSPRPICDACYRRKSRCAMNESVNKCYSCDFHRQDCTFSYSMHAQAQAQDHLQSQLGKRKFQDEFCEGPGADVDEDEGVKRTATEHLLSPITTASMPDSLLHQHAHPLSTATATGAIPRFPLEDSFITASQHIGMTTELEPLLLDYLTLDHNNESPLATSRVRKFADDGTFMRVINGSHARQELHTISVEAIENAVSPFGLVIIDKFFQHAHPAFPVLMENAFRRSYLTRRNLSPVLLAAVYFISLKWLDHGTAGVNPAPVSGSGVQALRMPDATRLEAMATRLLNESFARPQISTIQAGLLLSQKSTLNNPTLIAQLVTASYDLGLHQDCSSWKMAAWEKGLRKRLAWALYVQDKWCALVHGRPSHIFATNWTVKELTAEDFTDTHSLRRSNGSNNNSGSMGYPDISSSVGPGALFFRHFVTLTAILSEILDTFYTLQATSEFNAAGPQRTRIILERAKPIQIRLKEWFTRLPDELRMDHHHQYPLNHNSSSNNTHTNFMSVDTIINTNTNNPDRPNFNGGLHLAYFATEITLHRSIIRSLGPDSADPYLSHICRSAAKTRLISAMDFVNRLRPAHLRSFWPSASRTNFALISSFGILLRATALTNEEDEFYRMRLGEYRWTLSVSCKDAEFLVGAIEGLDIGLGLLRNVPPKKGLEEFVADACGNGIGKGHSSAIVIPNADDEIINIVEDEEGLDLDPDLEAEMEQLDEIEEMEEMEEMEEGEDVYSFSSGEYSEEYPHSRLQESSSGGAHNGQDHYNPGQKRGPRRSYMARFSDNANTNTDATMDNPKLPGAHESARRNLSRGNNTNRILGQRNRNVIAAVNVDVADRRSSSLPSVVSGLASPATSMEGERERERATEGRR